MALALRVFTCLFLMVCVVASVNADISCLTVAGDIIPCTFYLQNGGDVPSECCEGVQNLNDAAQTTPDRQQACLCLQNASHFLPGLNDTLVSGLPEKCGVNISYPISLTIDCDTIQ